MTVSHHRTNDRITIGSLQTQCECGWLSRRVVITTGTLEQIAQDQISALQEFCAHQEAAQ